MIIWKQNTGKNNISKEQVIHELITKIDQTMEKSNNLMYLYDVYNVNIDDAYSRYGNFIRLRTFRKYSEYLLSSIINGENEKRELLIKYPDIKNKLETIDYLINIHQDANDLYGDSLEKFFEDEFEKNNV